MTFCRVFGRKNDARFQPLGIDAEISEVVLVCFGPLFAEWRDTVAAISVFRMTNWREVFQFMKVPRIEATAWAAISLFMIVADMPIAIAVGLLIAMFLHIRKKQPILGKTAPGKSV